MAPVEPWERVWIDAKKFGDDVHSYINCTECHGGQSVDDFNAAHEGLVTEVVTTPEICGRCHVDVAQPAFASLHSTLAGYDTSLYARSVPENHAALEEMQANHCNQCHASCGDCHVSQPTNVGGGLVNGHVFNPSPSMGRQCTACHGSRVKNEYYGANEGVRSDVHFRARMDCMDCHTADSMHGMSQPGATSRYEGAQEPACQDCHKDVVIGDKNAEIEMHAAHDPDDLSCQVCHSTTYINCVNCHVQKSEDGIPFYTVENSFMGFYIGRNPNPTEDRPYEYVVVRHIPIAPDSFSYYGENLLPNFDSRPTWMPATPHNIQRITPQTESCDACHQNEDLFLTRRAVDSKERRANRDVIVDPGDLPD